MAISRAVRTSFEDYYKATPPPHGYDTRLERPCNWEEEEEVIAAICKSDYESRHLDFEYILELCTVFDHNTEPPPEILLRIF